MELTSTPCLCGCGQLITQPTTGRAKKYVDDHHRITHHRANKAALAAAKQPKPPTPPPTQTPDNDRLIGADGIDYTDPYKVMPAHLACYMPVQNTPGQRKADLLALEKRIFHATSDDKDCKF